MRKSSWVTRQRKPNLNAGCLGSILAFVILSAAFWAFLWIGWLDNLMNIIEHHGEFTGTLIVQIIGVLIVPLGIIMGWII